ncbi:MAG: InlB B-repeat-containing protein [Clostridiales bacterium]|nr:InlB B-repeat-containing protein [Clostridiales bacterium]
MDTQIVRHDQNARLKEEAGYDYTIKGSLTNVQSARTVEVTRKARPTATFMNDGVEYASIRAHDRNGNVNAPETNPMKQGYVFKGWSITPDGTAISFPTRITTDTTFYAVWAEAKTVAYLNEDGSAFATFSVEADTQAPVPSGNPEPAEGYAFAGWAKQGTQTVVDPATYTVNDNLTFVPVWVEVATVTFKNGNETEKEVTVVIGSKVSAADVPSLATTDTQAFKGWSLSENGPVVTVTDEVITANTTFYAVWAELATVTFKSGDTVAKTVKVEKGNKLSSADVPTLPAQEGSLFQGWLDAERRAG